MQKQLFSQLAHALALACSEAERYRGATAPNPPVGAAALDASGAVLGVAAHQKAGTAHAEAALLEKLKTEGLLSQVHTVVVTLEPCNHFGRTPPCSQALANLPSLKRVAYAVSDPNPKAQGGADYLRQVGAARGLEVIHLASLDLHPADLNPALKRAESLVAPFLHWIKTGRPYVTVKTAWRMEEGQPTMIPPPGQKTFTTPEQLKFAHELRRRADAIFTGSGTILADHPEFTVRHVPDHPGKARWLVVFDRRNRVSEQWLEGRRQAGFKTLRASEFPSILAILEFLGTQGVLEVLVEAGPTLSQAFLSPSLPNGSSPSSSNGAGIPLANEDIRIGLS